MVELVEYSSSKATIGSEVFLPSERSSLFQSPSTKIGSTWYPILKKDSVIVYKLSPNWMVVIQTLND